MRRTLALLLPVTLAWLYHTACTPPPDCFDGVWPPDGETGVSPDTAMWIDLSGAGQAYPAVAPGIRLEDLETGQRLPIDVELVDGLYRVRPERPLEVGRAYSLSGVHRAALDWSNVRYEAADGWGSHSASESHFVVGGVPVVLEGWQDFDGHATVRFSEPMDTSVPLEVAVFAPDLDGGTSVDVLHVRWSEDGRYAILTLDLEQDTGLLSLVDWTLELDVGAHPSARGPSTAAVDDLFVDVAWASEHRAALADGRAACEGW